MPVEVHGMVDVDEVDIVRFWWIFLDMLFGFFLLFSAASAIFLLIMFIGSLLMYSAVFAAITCVGSGNISWCGGMNLCCAVVGVGCLIGWVSLLGVDVIGGCITWFGSLSWKLTFCLGGSYCWLVTCWL